MVFPAEQEKMDSWDKQQPRLTTLYFTYLQQHDTRSFIHQVTQCYDESTLIRVTESVCVHTRRAAALVLGFVGTYQANDALSVLLKDRDRSVRLIAEGSMKLVWSREGSDAQRQQLYVVMRLISEHRFGEAVNRANILLDEFPHYAEARNQRSIALFALNKYAESIEDSRIALELNPHHFGAVIGMGHAYLQLHDTSSAIECFQQALSINPNLESVRRHLERLIQSWMR